MPQQQLDYQTRVGERTGTPNRRVVALAFILSATVAYNVFLARWKVTATFPGPAATFVDQGLAPFGNLVLGGIAVCIASWLPVRGWSLLWCVAVGVGIPLVGWQAVLAIR